MQPAGTNIPKQKTGIPQPVVKKTKNATNHNNVQHDKAEPDCQPPLNSARDASKSKPSTQGPLAAAMKKKTTQKKNQISESWADVKVESQSQKLKSQAHTDSSRRKEDIERQLQEAESQIGALTDLIEKREKMLEEERSDALSEVNELKERLMDQEGVLAEHGIDPVTGQKVPVSDEDKKNVETSKKITKKTVQAMRAKLQEMNRQTDSFLADIENTMHYLTSLEVASERSGPYSEETEAMISRLAGHEEAIKQVWEENAAPVKASTDSGESDDEDEVETEVEKGRGDDSQFFITDGADYEKTTALDTFDNNQGDTSDAKDLG